MNHCYFVGLTGKAGAGKDSVADALICAMGARGLRAERFAFADPIRQMLAAMGVPAQYMTDRVLKEAAIPGFGMSYRELAQGLGDWGREQHPEFWIRALGTRVIDSCARKGTPAFVVITDVRMVNEAQWVHDRQGCIVEVTRPNLAHVREHSSEQGLPRELITWELGNTTDLRALGALAGTLADRLGRERESAFNLRQQALAV